MDTACLHSADVPINLLSTNLLSIDMTASHPRGMRIHAYFIRSRLTLHGRIYWLGSHGSRGAGQLGELLGDRIEA